MAKKLRPAAERQRETIAFDRSSNRSRWITGRIPDPGGSGAGALLTWPGGPVMRKMTTPSEPTDILDAAAAEAGGVSGPEDPGKDWLQVDWRRCEREVRRLRQRIFTASRDGDLPRVRRLQELMLRSRSNALVSVRRVTERNAGRLTAGVDGEVVLSAEAKMQLASRIQHDTDTFSALPVRRVYIPKPGGKTKKRPLGIPAIAGRAYQAQVVNALEPEWEARFEPKSYGFRPGRGCHDAIQAIYQVVKGRSPKRLWVLDGDLAGAFDRISHHHILDMIGSFPARGMIAAWLRAGVVENGRLHRTWEGTPQGGVASPVLLNIALHGMEQAAGASYDPDGRVKAGCPVTIRYADDFVTLCHTRQEAHKVKARLAKWLEPRGLAFNDDKTQVVSLSEGFDFLGFNVRRYGTTPLIKPSKAAVRRIRQRLRAELWSLRGSNAQAVIKRLNPIIRGWAAYYRTQVSAKIFGDLDRYLWQLTYKWAAFSHINKPISWVINRYFGRFNKARNDRWVFGDRDSGAYLHRFAWTNIVRHQIVRYRASPDDPDLTDYWAWRRRKTPLPVNNTERWLHNHQDGRCHTCNGTLHAATDRPQTPQDWERWLIGNRAAITMITVPVPGTTGTAEPRLIHTDCANRSHRTTATPMPPGLV
jgi:RNA-directed DNA polymerase